METAMTSPPKPANNIVSDAELETLTEAFEADLADIDWRHCDIVESVPGRCGGVPVLKGTRLPVDAILVNYDGGLEPAEVAEIFEIAKSDVRTILLYRQARAGQCSSP